MTYEEFKKLYPTDLIQAFNIKHKLFCKFEKHNWILKNDIKYYEISETNEYSKITRRIAKYKTYMKCVNCGKIVELEE